MHVVIDGIDETVAPCARKQGLKTPPRDDLEELAPRRRKADRQRCYREMDRIHAGCGAIPGRLDVAWGAPRGLRGRSSP